MNERDMFDEHPDLVAVDKNVAEAWRRTAVVMADATFELTGVWQDPDDNFWENNSTFLSQQTPKIAEAIISRAEEFSTTRIAATETDPEHTNESQLKSLGRNILKRFFR